MNNNLDVNLESGKEMFSGIEYLVKIFGNVYPLQNEIYNRMIFTVWSAYLCIQSLTVS